MRELIFLDTESTGNEPGKDRLCQVCYRTTADTKVGLFKPPIPISVKAMSITHITNKQVEDKEAFSKSEMKKELQELLKEGVLVAHTALFDIAMLKAEGVEVPRFIDTLRVARYLDADNKIPEFNLQFLRYYLDLDVPGAAHDAEGDVNVLEALFKRLHSKLPDIEKLIEISARPTLFKNFIFGKYKGQAIEEVIKTDRRYMEWLLSQMTLTGSDTDEDWIFTLKHYLV
ncbi:MAG: exonuclease domain-containing protein [bacterium]|nr:exonuclease domain-containing protein [bacterium]